MRSGYYLKHNVRIQWDTSDLNGIPTRPTGYKLFWKYSKSDLITALKSELSTVEAIKDVKHGWLVTGLDGVYEDIVYYSKKSDATRSLKRYKAELKEMLEQLEKPERDKIELSGEMRTIVFNCSDLVVHGNFETDRIHYETSTVDEYITALKHDIKYGRVARPEGYTSIWEFTGLSGPFHMNHATMPHSNDYFTRTDCRLALKRFKEKARERVKTLEEKYYV